MYQSVPYLEVPLYIVDNDVIHNYIESFWVYNIIHKSLMHTCVCVCLLTHLLEYDPWTVRGW